MADCMSNFLCGKYINLDGNGFSCTYKEDRSSVVAREDCSPTHRGCWAHPTKVWVWKRASPQTRDCSEQKFGWLANSWWPMLTSDWREPSYPPVCEPQIFDNKIITPLIYVISRTSLLSFASLFFIWIQPRSSSSRRSLTRSLDLVEEFLPSKAWHRAPFCLPTHQTSLHLHPNDVICIVIAPLDDFIYGLSRCSRLS